MPIDYIDHLKKQLGFLERSCGSYDAGYKDEAVRIAVVLRVLFHQTNNSTSLITHLGEQSIKLANSVNGHRKVYQFRSLKNVPILKFFPKKCLCVFSSSACGVVG